MPHRFPDSYKNVLLTAMDGAREGITISDATLPDNPLIYVNRGFLQMTGYAAEEVLNKNCRFLQGSEAAQPGVAQIRNAIVQGSYAQVELVNFKKDGTPFRNRLSVTPVYDAANRLTHFIGVQEDVTALRQKEAETLDVVKQALVREVTLQTQAQEREAIGKELHDNINQLLATSRLLLNVATESEAERRKLAQQSSGLITNAIEEIRSLTKKLVQPQLPEATLGASLTALVQSLQPALPFSLQLAADVDEASLSDSKKVMLYRVVQEGLNNCVKYANPKKVAVALSQENGRLQLVLEDDGRGFDAAQAASGIGLRNLARRVEAESGTFAVQTAPGKGCRLIITVPEVPADEQRLSRA